MLHNRQAPGRDFHAHFSLAPARSDTLYHPPKQPAIRPRPQPPTRQGPSSQCDVESNPEKRKQAMCDDNPHAHYATRTHKNGTQL